MPSLVGAAAPCPACTGSPLGHRWELSVTESLSVSCRREKELAKVTIKKEDLELIVSGGQCPSPWG